MLLDRLVGHARVVAETAGRDALPLVERVGRRRPAWKQFVADAERVGELEKDVEVGLGLARRIDGAVRLADAPLRVRVGPFLLTPDRRRQHEIGVLRRRRRMKAVLNDQELEAFERLLQHAEIRERDDRIRRDDPQRADPLVERRFDDVRVGETACRRNPFDRHVPERAQVRAIGRVLELAIAGHARRETGLARPHRVALAGDRERRGTRPPDVAGDQRQVVDRVDGLRSLRAVIHAHRPGDERPLGVGVEPSRPVDQLRTQDR